MEDLAHMGRTVKGVYFPYPLIVSAGWAKTAHQMQYALQHDFIAELGSIETNPSEGNGKRDYYASYKYVGDVQVLINTINSQGIRNPGMRYVEQHAPLLLRMYAYEGFPLIINISGTSVADTVELLKRAIVCGFHVIIVNGACPNKANQPILCWDTEAVDELFDRVETEIGPVKPLVLWKVSVGMPRAILAHNKARVVASSVFDGIATGNTMRDGFDYAPNGETAILTENGLDHGGVGGPAILPFALSDTLFCGSSMPPGKISYGLGGVSDGTSAMKYIRAKATLVGLQSAFIESEEDPDFMRELLWKLGKRMWKERGVVVPFPKRP